MKLFMCSYRLIITNSNSRPFSYGILYSKPLFKYFNAGARGQGHGRRFILFLARVTSQNSNCVGMNIMTVCMWVSSLPFM